MNKTSTEVTQRDSNLIVEPPKVIEAIVLKDQEKETGGKVISETLMIEELISRSSIPARIINELFSKVVELEEYKRAENPSPDS